MNSKLGASQKNRQTLAAEENLFVSAVASLRSVFRCNLAHRFQAVVAPLMFIIVPRSSSQLTSNKTAASCIGRAKRARL